MKRLKRGRMGLFVAIGVAALVVLGLGTTVAFAGPGVFTGTSDPAVSESTTSSSVPADLGALGTETTMTTVEDDEISDDADDVDEALSEDADDINEEIGEEADDLDEEIGDDQDDQDEQEIDEDQDDQEQHGQDVDDDEYNEDHEDGGGDD